MKNILILISFLFSSPLFGQVEDWHPNTRGTKNLQSNVVSAASETLVCGQKILIVPGVTTTLTLPQFSVSDQSCYFSFTVKDSTSFDTVKINLTVGDTILGEDCITKATQLILLANADFQIWKGSDYWEYKSIGSSAASPTVIPLTKGRVHALLDLASTTHVNTDPGTKIPFTGSPYVSGMTASAGSITPSVGGSYRADWLCMAASTDFEADGIFHVVQNGVSVGQVSYNMNQASAVNQSAGFIDVNLVAGQEVSLHYRTRHTASDGIAWDRGSYFQLTQLPTAVTTVLDGTIQAVDQSSAGYFDIGNMRMQWGTTGSVFTNAIITFPAPFANTNYSLSGVVPNNTTALFSTSTTTTTTFTANLWNTNGGGGAVGVVRWIAIGQKP